MRREQGHAYVDGLGTEPRYPGIRALGYIPRLLVQDPEHASGFLLFAPVHAGNRDATDVEVRTVVSYMLGAEAREAKL